MVLEQMFWMGPSNYTEAQIWMGANQDFHALHIQTQQQYGMLKDYFLSAPGIFSMAEVDALILVGNPKTICLAKEVLTVDQATMLITCCLENTIDGQIYEPEANECAIVFKNSEIEKASVTVFALMVAILVHGHVCFDYADLQSGFSKTVNKSVIFELDTSKEFHMQTRSMRKEMRASKSLLCSCFMPTEFNIESISEIADIIYDLCLDDDTEVFFSVVTSQKIAADTMKVAVIYS